MPKALVDRVGERCGALKITSRAIKDGKSGWLCDCDCGAMGRFVERTAWRRLVSCGCGLTKGTVHTADLNTAVAAYRCGATLSEASATGNCGYLALKKALSAGGFNRKDSRKYVANDSFFSQIDTDEKAYLLGFIAADGCLAPDRNRVIIDIQEKDAAFLEAVRDRLSPSTPIVRPKGRACVTLSFSSSQMIADLTKAGLTPRKSLTLTPWAGPPHLLAAYYRGLIDGDGSWRYREQSQNQFAYSIYVDLLSTMSVVQAFRGFISDRLGINDGHTRQHPKTPSLFQVRYARCVSVQKIAALLYENATLWLWRKRETANKILAIPARLSASTAAARIGISRWSFLNVWLNDFTVTKGRGHRELLLCEQEVAAAAETYRKTGSASLARDAARAAKQVPLAIL